MITSLSPVAPLASLAPAACSPTWLGSTAATSSRSSASETARQTSWPMRPPAPTTATFCMCSTLVSRGGGQVVVEGIVVERPDRAERARRLYQLVGHRQYVLRPDGLDTGQDVVHRAHFAVQQGGGPDAAHAGPRVLTREQHLGPDVAPGHGQLPISDAVGGQELQLAGDDPQHLGDMLGGGAHHDGERPGILVGGPL